jgi:crotonobetainyl-CoA:carnitine CoA-transferase CaiB-like acyl-CoA transferase
VSHLPKLLAGNMSGALDGILVVALEQAVAAPMATARLADAGARVIKLERPEGDFSRSYDDSVFGQSTYFVWINRGKESCRVDLKTAQDLTLVERMLARADVFVQNLAPGATGRLGLGSAELRARHPRLIVCDISGYTAGTPMYERKAYDLLVQAETGLASSRDPRAPAPIGSASRSAIYRRATPPMRQSSRRFCFAVALARARISSSRSSTPWPTS